MNKPKGKFKNLIKVFTYDIYSKSMIMLSDFSYRHISLLIHQNILYSDETLFTEETFTTGKYIDSVRHFLFLENCLLS